MVGPPPLHSSLGAHFAAVSSLFATSVVPPPTVEAPIAVSVPTTELSSSVSDAPASPLELTGFWSEHPSLFWFLLTYRTSFSNFIEDPTPEFPRAVVNDPLIGPGLHHVKVTGVGVRNSKGRWRPALTYSHDHFLEIPDMDDDEDYFFIVV